MGKKLIPNPTTGELDFIDITDTSVLVSKTTQNLTTTDATPTAVTGSITVPINTTMRFHTIGVGRGASGEVYHYEITGSVKNIADTLTLGTIIGTTHEEALALGNDTYTDHAIGVTVPSTDLLLTVTGFVGTTIIWEFETTTTEV